jgi:3-methylfumaryl-CoA hydratase
MTEAVDLQQWVGRTESRNDVVVPWPAKALAATLDRDDPEPVAGAELPQGWHWLYFLEARRASEVGTDGHPKRGGFLPPVALPRRMWAGGRVDFVQPLRFGEAVCRDSEILKVDQKIGATGNLVFVTVRHTVKAGDGPAIVEEQDIVYREAAKPGDAPPPTKAAPASASWSREVVPDPVLLFRYSALTFNGHRIHYDKDYATGAEHYRGLVVHGPLQTTLLLDLCRRHAGRPLKRLEYRAMSPLFHDQPFTVNGQLDAGGAKAELWTASAAGQYAMRGTAYF